jgi:hypothetical protein
VFTWIKTLHQAVIARLTAYWRKREVVQVLKVTHLQDLTNSPVSLHPLIRAQHAVEIDGIMAGRLNMVDRRTVANTGLPISFTRVNTPVAKQTPITLRRFSRTPVPARAINLTKAGLLALQWKVRAIEGIADSDDPDVMRRCQIVTNCLQKPNNDDSFRSWIEQILTDFLVYGMGCSETQANPFDDRPVKMWPTDANTIQIVTRWTEDMADQLPRYVQMLPFTTTTQSGVQLFDDELWTIRDNIATDSPFGTGCLEIAYRSVIDLLGAQRMAGIAGSDQLGRQIFWWSGAIPPTTMQDMRGYLQNELEGMARVGMVGGGPKPEVITIDPVSIEDLLLPWQEMLIRMIANSFNISPLALALERDVNKSTGEVMDDRDFRSCIVPVAKRFQESLTRHIIHKKCGWEDLEFVFLGTEDPDTQTKLEILEARYQASAITGNDMNEALGYKRIDSPFADMTQIELVILQASVQGMQQQAAAAQQQQQPGLQHPGMPQGNTFSQPAGLAAPSSKVQSPTVPKVTVPKAPKVAVPKIPRLGGALSAAAIADMSKAYIKALQLSRVLPKSTIVLADEMEQEQPGVLQQLTDEVWEYFEHLAELEIENSKTKKATLSKKWLGLAKKRYSKDAKRLKDLQKNGGLESLAPVTASGTTQKPVKSPRRRQQSRTTQGQLRY